MEVVKTVVKIDCDIHIKLTYEEAAALIDIVGYGAEPFLNAFKEHLGKHYITKHQDGIRSLFPKIWDKLPKQLYQVEEIRRRLEKLNSEN